jgi:hypothetical protein
VCPAFRAVFWLNGFLLPLIGFSRIIVLLCGDALFALDLSVMSKTYFAVAYFLNFDSCF